MAKKRISQADIARDLGVSQALVSMVLNGRRDGIADSTVRRIWKHATDCGYTPKGMTVGGLGAAPPQRTAVGYFLRSPLRLATKSNFFSHVSQGLHDSLAEQELSFVFLGAEGDFDEGMERRVRVQLPSLRGLVVLGEVEPPFRDWVHGLGLPTVMVSGRAAGIFHSVNSNEHQAGGLLVKHLVGLGHRDFAYLGGESPRGRNDERLAALRQGLRREGLDLRPACVVTEEDADRAAGFAAADGLLKARKEDRPTAWICVNALMARGAASRLLVEGVEIGRDVSLAAFDMTRVCDEEPPLLCSAAAIPEEMGREAARLLLDSEANADGALRDVAVPAKFLPRASTGAPRKRLAV